MLRPGARRKWPGCCKPTFRKELENRRDLATNGHCGDTLSNVMIPAQKSGWSARGTSVSLFAQYSRLFSAQTASGQSPRTGR